MHRRYVSAKLIISGQPVGNWSQESCKQVGNRLSTIKCDRGTGTTYKRKLDMHRRYILAKLIMESRVFEFDHRKVANELATGY